MDNGRYHSLFTSSVQMREKINMNSPVLPPQKLIVPQEFSLQLGFNLFPVVWVHIFVVYSYTTKLVAYEPFRSISLRRKCHEFKAAQAF